MLYLDSRQSQWTFTPTHTNKTNSTNLEASKIELAAFSLVNKQLKFLIVAAQNTFEAKVYVINKKK